MEERCCYFSNGRNDKLWNTFISKRLKNNSSGTDSIQFQIEWLVSRRQSSETYDATSKLGELLDDDRGTHRSVETSEREYPNAEYRSKQVGGKIE